MILFEVNGLYASNRSTLLSMRVYMANWFALETERFYYVESLRDGVRPIKQNNIK